MTSVINQAIANTNDSFKRSKLNFINIVPVTIYKEDDDEPQNWNDILKAFYDPNDSIFNRIHEIRKQNKANLAILIVGNNNYCGEAKVIAANQPEDTFAIVSHECAADYYSFAHEIGHLIGARHEYCSDSTMEPYPFGHGYLSKTLEWRTIMSYANCCQGNNCVRIRNWANPYVKYKGEKTGSLAKEYDAKVWRMRAAEISNIF
ncbi:M12 family metallo-peptidase [Methylomonas denitrificans]|uniref:M12 family metallo-peptidase n=1 Tax=Methylomonas denitrificans TaxID=1538553 RepID=UPI0009E77BA3